MPVEVIGSTGSFSQGRQLRVVSPDDPQLLRRIEDQEGRVADRYLDARRVGQFITGLRRTFPEFDTYPYDAQVAPLDLAFNTGSVTAGNFPLLTAPVRRRDWRTATEQSHRKTSQIGAARDEFTRRLFLSAAAAESSSRRPERR